MADFEDLERQRQLHATAAGKSAGALIYCASYKQARDNMRLLNQQIADLQAEIKRLREQN